ncbi:MAG: ankyrin repeat domain-containing protein, partial [Planctomycetes bacterium]|nr:ankyrin repeat domain-containing protein [Planctomycetota bacterium]
SLAVAGPVRNIEERIKTIMKPGKKFYKRPSLVAAVIVLLVAVLAVPTALVLTARAETEAVVGPEEIPTKALHQAAADGDIEQVKLLISKGADVNAKDMQGRTPLHGAAFRGHKDVVGLLLAKGADVNAQDRNGRTPVDAALGRGNTKAVVKLLVARGAKVSPLHGAAYLGDLDKVKAVVEAGTDVNAKDKMGRVPLDYAATKEVAQVLIAKGSDISTEARSGRDPLYWAAFFGHKEVVEFLIAKGADVNPKDPCDYTPLEGVATEGHHDVAELLIAKGADINAGQNKTWTALHAAVAVGHKNVAELLIAEGADVNAKDRYGYTPLYLAWKRDLAELLIANGADLNAKDNQGRTPMSYWREVGTGEIADLLRKHGAKEDCIQIEAWFLLVPDDAREVKDFLEQENLESSKIQGDPNSRSYFLNAEQVEQLWELARLNTEYKLLMVPTLEVVDGKTATIRTTKATHYISGYSEPNRPSEKPEPKKDSVETGAWLTVKPKLQPDSQGTLTIDFDFEISNITGYEKLTYKGKYPYEIPIIEKVAVSAHYTVAADQTLLLCGRKITDPDDGRTEHKDLFVLIKAKKVEPKGAQVDSLPVTRD